MVKQTGTGWILRRAVVVVLGLAAAAPALADETGRLEDVVVTAQRREAPLQDVPAAVSALTGAELEGAGAARVDDFASSVPNVYINANNDLRNTNIVVRGISSNPNNPGVDPSVGIFVDGVYMSRPTTINANIYDIDRIEFVRGPQGALYGKNTIAGAMNFITRLPTETPEADLAVDFGNYSAVSAYASVSGPLGSDAVLGRLSVSTQHRDGLVTNLYTGTKLDNVDEDAGRVALLFKLSSDVQLLLRADKSRDRTNDGSADVYLNGEFAGTPYADASPWDRVVNDYRDTVQNRDVSGVSAQLDWHTTAGRLTSLSAYRQYTWYNFADNTYAPVDLLSSGITEDQSEWSEDLRWVSDLKGPLSYIVGAYYSRQHLDTVSTATFGAGLGVYPQDESAQIFGNITTESTAAYLQVGYDFTARWSASASVRYSDEKKDLDASGIGDPYGVFLASYAERSLTRTDDKTTASATISYKPDPAVLAYATYSQGFKAGGFNVFSVTPTDDARYAPETVDSYEAGLKLRLFDGRMFLNLAAYYLDYQNLQVNQLLLINGVPQYTTSNAATAQSTGFELEARAALATGLDGTLAYGYNDSHYRSYANATPAGADYSGNQLPDAARNSVSAALDYRHPVAAQLDLIARADVTYRSGTFFDPSNDPVLTQGGYTLVNARLGVGHGTRWSVVLWGKNLTNKLYAVTREDGPIVPGQVIQSLGFPRMYGVEGRVGF
jgi:iron complex outermembrane receptor protein